MVERKTTILQEAGAEATRARIEALILPHLEELTLALLDFQGADDLQAWFDRRK